MTAYIYIDIYLPLLTVNLSVSTILDGHIKISWVLKRNVKKTISWTWINFAKLSVTFSIKES